MKTSMERTRLSLFLLFTSLSISQNTGLSTGYDYYEEEFGLDGNDSSDNGASGSYSELDESFDTTEYKTSGENVSTPPEVLHCSLPLITYNGSSVQDGFPYSHVTSVAFKVETGSGEVLNCNLECRDGEWTGPYCGGEEYKHGCTLDYISSSLEVFQDHNQVTDVERREFPHNSILRVRCRDPQHYLEGSSHLICSNSQWTAKLPYCSRTSTIEDYSETFPPGIEAVTSTQTSIFRGREGELIVPVGSLLHLDCIYDRRRGTPQWSWSHTFRDYPTGWVVSETEKNWKFRLSLVYAREQDSGVFNCTTPRGLENSLQITVTGEQCTLLQSNDYIRYSSEEVQPGANITCYCPTGYTLRGESNLLCRDDATWSSPVPSCSPVSCPALEMSSLHLRVLRLNNSFLGEAEFDCPYGYNLTGEKTIWCNHLGEWSAVIPTCQAIVCSPPVPPANGQIIETEDKHYVGTTVQTTCNPGFVLIGEPVIRCSQDGLWSGSTPLCKLACRYPGIPHNGFISPIKFVYSVGEKILVDCNSGSTLIGENILECTNSGEWSRALPQCDSYL